MATLNSFRCTDAVDSRQPWAFSSPRRSLIATIIFRDVTMARRSLYIVNAAWLFLTQRISERRVPLRGNGKKWIAGCSVRSAFSRDYRRDGLTLIVVVAGSSLSQGSKKKSIRSSWLPSFPRRKIKISVFIFGFVKLAISHEFVLFLSFVFLCFFFSSSKFHQVIVRETKLMERSYFSQERFFRSSYLLGQWDSR